MKHQSYLCGIHAAIVILLMRPASGQVVGLVRTLAGNTTAGHADGQGTRALFSSPYHAQLSTDGSFALVADYSSRYIRRIDIATAAVSTVCGNGSAGRSDGVGTVASFVSPTAIAIVGDGSYALITDSSNCLLRRINVSSGSVTTVAGGASCGTADGVGTLATMTGCASVAMDAAGTFALLACYNSPGNVIRRIELATFNVTTVAGSGASGYADGYGTSAAFRQPRGVAMNAAATFALIADSYNCCLRHVVVFDKSYLITTLAGTCSTVGGYADGVGTQALFSSGFRGVALTAAGDAAFIADTYNSCLRYLNVVTRLVTTLAGSVVSGRADGQGSAASFTLPWRISVDYFGGLGLVADMGNNIVRTVELPSPSATPTSTSTPTPSLTQTASQTATQTSTTSESFTASQSATRSASPTNTQSGSSSQTPSISQTQSSSSCPTATTTGSSTASQTASDTQAQTRSMTQSLTQSATPTQIATPSSSLIASGTRSFSASVFASETGSMSQTTTTSYTRTQTRSGSQYATSSGTCSVAASGTASGSHVATPLQAYTPTDYTASETYTPSIFASASSPQVSFVSGAGALPASATLSSSAASAGGNFTRDSEGGDPRSQQGIVIVCTSAIGTLVLLLCTVSFIARAVRQKGSRRTQESASALVTPPSMPDASGGIVGVTTISAPVKTVDLPAIGIFPSDVLADPGGCGSYGVPVNPGGTGSIRDEGRPPTASAILAASVSSAGSDVPRAPSQQRTRNPIASGRTARPDIDSPSAPGSVWYRRSSLSRVVPSTMADQDNVHLQQPVYGLSGLAAGRVEVAQCQDARAAGGGPTSASCIPGAAPDMLDLSTSMVLSAPNSALAMGQLGQNGELPVAGSLFAEKHQECGELSAAAATMRRECAAEATRNVRCGAPDSLDSHIDSRLRSMHSQLLAQPPRTPSCVTRDRLGALAVLSLESSSTPMPRPGSNSLALAAGSSVCGLHPAPNRRAAEGTDNRRRSV